MNRYFSFLFAFFLIMIMSACAKEPSAKSRIPDAAYGVIGRVCGDKSNFILKYAPKNDTNLYDTFTYVAKDGKVLVTGENDLAICRGVYEYLKKHAHVMLTWSERKIKLPKKLPPCEETRGGTYHQFRLYYNVCVFGYTTPYWDWKRWEEEIDWMAFHGINMPLAMNGQEAVWQRVWQRHYVSQPGIDELFCGPAYAPWQRMGNINNFNGPQPQEYMQQALELQKKCLARMKKLGMSPVVPGFSGFVPREFAEKIKESDPETGKFIHKSAGWAGFRDDQKSWWLSPKSDLFRSIAVEMVREYTNVFGPQKYFLIDSFNEMQVPITGDKNVDLREYGEKSYLALKAGIEDAVWLMQGWMFNYSRHFWTKEATAAFLEKVPDDKMIIIDLGTERYKGWKEHQAFYGKKWINSYIHNFGGYDGMFGNTPRLMELTFEPLNDKGRGKQVGMGYSPEGVCQNEIVYELMTDSAWLKKPMDIEVWVKDFVTARYGACPENLWNDGYKLMWQHFYRGGGGGHFRYEVMPQLATDTYGLNPNWLKSLETMLACSNQFFASESYWDDMVELANHISSSLSDNLIAITILAAQLGDKEKAKQYQEYFNTVLSQVDALNCSRRQFMLSTWTGFAEKWSKNVDLKKYFCMDARRLITVWGGHLDGYVGHHWGGLIANYYQPRWNLFLTEYLEGKPLEEINKKVRAFEENWVINGPDGPDEPTQDVCGAVNDTVKVIKKYAALAEEAGKKLVAADRGTFLGTWNANKEHVLTNKVFLVSNQVNEKGDYQLLVKGGGFFRECQIAIAMNGKPVVWGTKLPIDKKRHEEARYDFKLEEHQPGASYTIEIFFKEKVDFGGAEIWLKKK